MYDNTDLKSGIKPATSLVLSWDPYLRDSSWDLRCSENGEWRSI